MEGLFQKKFEKKFITLPLFALSMSEAFDAAWSILKYSEGECAICGKHDALYMHPGAGHDGSAEPSLCKDCAMDRDLASRTYG